MKNRDEAGLSPEAVRLLHSFYTELDSVTTTATPSDDPAGMPGVATLYTECPVFDLANHVPLKRQLEGRHLSVLINLIMLLVEEEQKDVQRFLKFATLLAQATESGAKQNGTLNEAIRAYPAQHLIQLKALTHVLILRPFPFFNSLLIGAYSTKN